jgi:hypothetical protein
MAANRSQQKKWVPLAILAAALIVWATLLALGAFLELGADEPRHDFRKPMLVLGAMTAFLAVWGVALWNRDRQQRQK